MNEHVEDKLTGWATIIIAFGWIVAVLICALFVVLALSNESFFLLLIGIAGAADVLMIHYFTSRLTLAFADITQNTREMNLNIQKAFLENIQATEQALAKKEQTEKKQIEEQKREVERKSIEMRQAAARRKEAYWQEHSKEKDMLLAKREEAQKAIRSTGKLPAKEKAQLEELIQKIDAELNRER